MNETRSKVALLEGDVSDSDEITGLIQNSDDDNDDIGDDSTTCNQITICSQSTRPSSSQQPSSKQHRQQQPWTTTFDDDNGEQAAATAHNTEKKPNETALFLPDMFLVGEGAVLCPRQLDETRAVHKDAKGRTHLGTRRPLHRFDSPPKAAFVATSSFVASRY